MQRFAPLALVFLAACVVGAPPGFSDGDRWTAPMVAPLEGGRILLPVKINDTGPYLFVIDPDAQRSAVDSFIQSRLRLFTVQAREEHNEADQMVPTRIAEVKKISIGTLDVTNQRLRVFEEGTFWETGRKIQGILGRDLIAESLILSVDRDAGLVHIATRGNESPPEGAEPVRYRRFQRVDGRRLTTARVNEQKELSLHLDLGAKSTMLWPKVMDELNLPHIPVRATLRDEYGTERTVSRGGLIAMLDVGPVRAQAILALPFDDQRIRQHEFDGAVGQDVFSQFEIMADWHDKTIWMKRRDADLGETAGARMARWGEGFAACNAPACVSVSVEAELPGPAPGAAPTEATPARPAADTAPGAEEGPTEPGAPGAEEGPTEPGAPGEATAEAAPAGPAPEAGAPPKVPARPAPVATTLRVEREASSHGFSYDVLLEALDASGQPLGLPRLLATLPSGTPTLTVRGLDPAYADAASFAVLDANLVGLRQCEASTCAWALQPTL